MRASSSWSRKQSCPVRAWAHCELRRSILTIRNTGAAEIRTLADGISNAKAKRRLEAAASDYDKLAHRGAVRLGSCNRRMKRYIEPRPALSDRRSYTDSHSKSIRDLAAIRAAARRRRDIISRSPGRNRRHPEVRIMPGAYPRAIPRRISLVWSALTPEIPVLLPRTG